jgi:probable rRNA maturation factor
MEIALSNMQDLFADVSDLDKLAERVLGRVAIEKGLDEDVEVGVLWVDDSYIRTLNQTYRGLDCPTDVLSFALQEQSEDEPDVLDDPFKEMLLGDIIISLETAERQAVEFGHSLEREVGFLLVHGVLHLLGFDHQAETECLLMRQEEEKILDVLGIKR